jgi:hypothetical protein
MHTHAAEVWDLSIAQGAISVAPCQTLALRFSTLCIAVCGWVSEPNDEGVGHRAIHTLIAYSNERSIGDRRGFLRGRIAPTHRR